MATPTDQVVSSPTPPKPERYIRTFAGDMAVKQQGGTPDLIPYEKHQEAVAALKPLVPPAPSPQDEPKPAPPPPPPEITWSEQLREAARARVEARIAEDAAIGIHRSTERPRPLLVDEENSPLRTYSDDFTDRVEREGASKVSILAAEQDAGSHTGTEESSEMSQLKKGLVIGAGVLLLIGGGGGAYYAYARYVAAHLPVSIIAPTRAPIYYDEREEVSGEGAALLQAIATSVGHPLSTKKVRLLSSTSATTTRQSIFVTLRLGAPSVLVRNIVGQGSMVGIVNTGGNTSAFFILEVASYNETFAGMLAWEPQMQRDLAALYPLAPMPALLPDPVLATTTATSTKTSTTTSASSTPPTPAPLPQTPGFKDEVVANRDVRVYHDAFGAVVFLYGYSDQKTLVIAKDMAAFSEIVGRLAASRN